MAGARVIYLDSCVLIAWITEETRPDPADLDGILYWVEQWELRNVVFVVSALVRAEVLEADLTDQQAEKFKAFLKRSTVHEAGVSAPIIDLAHDIRSYYKRTTKFAKVKVPDAIHLATAIAERCELFLTFDGKPAGTGKPRKKLLALGPTIGGTHHLPIAAPLRPPPPPPPPEPPRDRQANLFDEKLLAPPPGKRLIEP